MSDGFKKILPHCSTESPKKRQSPCLAEFKKFKVVCDYGDKNEQDEFNNAECWYCGKSRGKCPPEGCTLTHKYEKLADSKYKERDPYRLLRSADGGIIVRDPY